MYLIFYKLLLSQPTHPLRQIMMNNASPPCITATAGTKFVRTSYFNAFIIRTNERALRQLPSFSPTKYSWINLSTIVQIFSTADPRKSLDLISVLM